MTEPRVWNVDDLNNPPEPWVWGENPPDSTDLRITTDQSAVRRYTLEPDIAQEGNWTPVGTANSHPWSYWLAAKWDPLTEVPPA
jgi:hypothetical protein